MVDQEDTISRCAKLLGVPDTDLLAAIERLLDAYQQLLEKMRALAKLPKLTRLEKQAVLSIIDRRLNAPFISNDQYELLRHAREVLTQQETL